MSCGTGECGCGCGEFHHIHVKPNLAVKLGAKELEGEEPKPLLAETWDHGTYPRAE